MGVGCCGGWPGRARGSRPRLRRARVCSRRAKDDLHRQLVQRHREQLAEQHCEPAVAGHRHDLAAGVGALCADRVPQGIRHRPVPERADHPSPSIGVFPAEDPQSPDELARDGRLEVPWGPLFAKGVSIGMGRDHDERYNDFLRDLIAAGRLRASEIVSHRCNSRRRRTRFGASTSVATATSRSCSTRSPARSQRIDSSMVAA
jgi:hypothetical protein